MNKQRLSILIISTVGILGTLMPWMKIPILGSMNGVEHPIGVVTLVLFFIPLILSLIGDKMKELKGWLFGVSITVSVIVFLSGIIYIAAIKVGASRSQSPFEKLFTESMSLGFGIYLVIIASIALPLFAFLMREPKKKKIVKENIKIVVPEKKEELKVDVEFEGETVDREDPRRFMPK